jgi:transcriptional regulator with XRE-family HTH domain
MTAEQHQEAFQRHVLNLRKVRGWTQEEMVALLAAAGWRLSRVTLSKVETLDRPVKLGEAVVLAKVLGVDLALLVSPEPITIEVSA